MLIIFNSEIKISNKSKIRIGIFESIIILFFCGVRNLISKRKTVELHIGNSIIHTYSSPTIKKIIQEKIDKD